MTTDADPKKSESSKPLLEPQASCRERSNESNMRGQCMRCGAEPGEACRDPIA
jgi:hypothetical protein